MSAGRSRAKLTKGVSEQPQGSRMHRRMRKKTRMTIKAAQAVIQSLRSDFFSKSFRTMRGICGTAWLTHERCRAALTGNFLWGILCNDSLRAEFALQIVILGMRNVLLIEGFQRGLPAAKGKTERQTQTVRHHNSYWLVNTQSQTEQPNVSDLYFYSGAPLNHGLYQHCSLALNQS